MKPEPTIGSPPIPMEEDWPIPRPVSCQIISYVRVPLRDTTPTFPSRWMKLGMKPTLPTPGVVIPGQFGPTIREPDPFSACFTLIISATGRPSVRQTISPIPASIASKIASGANAAGV